MAVKALTSQIPSDSNERSTSVDEQKEAFTTAASQYFSLLSAIDVRLRRQVYALEEAGIVSAEVASKEPQSTLSVPGMPAASGGSSTATTSSQGTKEKSSGSGSGLGNLDVGWLNSRNDKVGKEMEAELWAEARELVETYVKEQRRGARKDDADVSMEEAEKDDPSITLVEG